MVFGGQTEVSMESEWTVILYCEFSIRITELNTSHMGVFSLKLNNENFLHFLIDLMSKENRFYFLKPVKIKIFEIVRFNYFESY